MVERRPENRHARRDPITKFACIVERDFASGEERHLYCEGVPSSVSNLAASPDSVSLAASVWRQDGEIALLTVDAASDETRTCSKSMTPRSSSCGTGLPMEARFS